LSAAAVTRTRTCPAETSGMDRSVRYSIWSSPPCAEMVSARNENLERYIQNRTACVRDAAGRYRIRSHSALT
jgi:hypothetical protein